MQVTFFLFLFIVFSGIRWEDTGSGRDFNSLYNSRAAHCLIPCSSLCAENWFCGNSFLCLIRSINYSYGSVILGHSLPSIRDLAIVHQHISLPTPPTPPPPRFDLPIQKSVHRPAGTAFVVLRDNVPWWRLTVIHWSRCCSDLPFINRHRLRIPQIVAEFSTLNHIPKLRNILNMPERAHCSNDFQLPWRLCRLMMRHSDHGDKHKRVTLTMYLVP